MMPFPYLPRRTRRPVYPLGGAQVRHLPIFPVTVEGPLGFRTLDCRLDSGADDTIFPLHLAGLLGINLSSAPQGESSSVSGTTVTYPYAHVTLRVTDGAELAYWQAGVGFANLPHARGLLGLTGFLEFFDATLKGEDREVWLTPNGTFPGQYLVF